MSCAFAELISGFDPTYLTFERLQTLQVNMGDLCNQRCEHCHLEAGPDGRHVMGRNVVDRILEFLRGHRGLTLDITGGCPELNPHFTSFVEGARGTVSKVMVRTNLSILVDEGMEWLPGFYRDNAVELIGSLPCYTPENVDRQRGNGIFKKCIDALKRLNAVGYGDALELNLVYNPGGDFLPGAQADLERDYRERLTKDHGVRFNNLFTITNAPLGRFRDTLERSGRFEGYMKLLQDNFNPNAAVNVMCRSLISVDWRGVLYNCDFNQALGMAITRDGRELTISEIAGASFEGKEILVDDHCFCCTAGSGSSCTGTLA